MPERFEDAIKALRHISRGNGSVMRIADRIVAAHEREYDELRMKYVNVNRHAQHVERENESLKAELDRVLGEREEHQHSIGEVTVTVTPRLDWSAVVADLRELTALCERTKEDA